jgi:hypothetical protein
MASLGLGFASAAMAVIIVGQPECVDATPHCAEEFGEPLALRVGHRTVVTDAVLLLQVAPFFTEFASEEVVVPTYGALLLEKSLVAWGIGSRVYGLNAEPTKETFRKDVQQDRVKEGIKFAAISF